MEIYNKRMLMLLDALMSDDKETDDSFCKKIGFNKSNLNKVGKGVSFTLKHIIKASKIWDISTDWICGFSNEMKRKKSKDPFKNLKDAFREFEQHQTRYQK